MPDNLTKTPSVSFSIQGWDINHYRNTEAYVAMIRQLYYQAAKAFANLASKADYNPNKPFSFDSNIYFKKVARKIIDDLAANIKAVIEKGIENEWVNSNKKADEFIKTIIDTSQIDRDRLESFKDRNLDALKAFQKRKTDGMDLSLRVWKYAGQMKTLMENGIDVHLGEGLSAQSLSQELRNYLQNPDKLFRRVRDKRGVLRASKTMQVFHPGQGVYRSSYKNAMRLARSEINMSYRTADQLRWDALSFVVGFEVKRSNHEYDCETCDQLKGKYPKWFVFKGWHPQCRCFMIPILMNRDDFNTDELNELKAALHGTEYKRFEARNTVNDVPEGFKKWVINNKQASKGWASQPYFIRDNFKGGRMLNGLKNPVGEQQSKLTGESDPLSLIEKKEDEIRRNKSFETAVLFNDDGQVIFEKKGRARSVNFTDEEVALFKDKIFTHNHPTGWFAPEGSIGRIGNSFSPPDVLTSIKNDVKELRVATPLMRFSMKRPTGGWPLLKDAIFEIKRLDYIVTEEYYSRINNGYLTEGQASVTHWHEIWKRFSEQFEIEYSKKGAPLPGRKH